MRPETSSGRFFSIQPMMLKQMNLDRGYACS